VHRPAFAVTFVAMPGVDGIKALRSLLKAALRHHGLRAIDARELDERAFVFPSHPPRSTRETTMSAFSERIRSQTKGFYKVADFEGGKEITHTISHLDEEMEMFNKTVDILNFSDTGRQLSVNQTNAEWLLNNLGNNPEQLAGKKGDALSRGVRVRREKGTDHPPQAAGHQSHRQGRRCHSPRTRGRCCKRARAFGQP
jgi:hypothetical protein